MAYSPKDASELGGEEVVVNDVGGEELGGVAFDGGNDG